MINPNEAPEGDVAVKPKVEGACDGCKYLSWDTGNCPSEDYSCLRHERLDKQTVIFVDRIASTENGKQDLIWIDEANDLSRLPISEELEALAKQYLAQYHEGPGAAGFHINNFLKWVKENGKAQKD